MGRYYKVVIKYLDHGVRLSMFDPWIYQIQNWILAIYLDFHLYNENISSFYVHMVMEKLSYM